jgi:hypothetical protein
MYKIDEIASEIAVLLSEDTGLPGRLMDYSWGGTTAEDTILQLYEIEYPKRLIFRKILRKEKLSLSELSSLSEFAISIFEWGRVTRGNAEIAKNGELVASVIDAGLSWHIPSKNVPMNSGWTKVAALATEFVEAEGGTPQIIFDSRVAASLLSRLDKVLNQVPTGDDPRKFLPHELAALGWVPGRGGTRTTKGRREHRLHWTNRYKRWDAQFSATRLVSAIRQHVNRELSGFGKMPFSPYENGTWSTRGIEMILFMDGY